MESSTSCSISICHPDRLRLRGNLADIVMMSTMKVMMVVVLVRMVVMDVILPALVFMDIVSY